MYALSSVITWLTKCNPLSLEVVRSECLTGELSEIKAYATVAAVCLLDGKRRTHVDHVPTITRCYKSAQKVELVVDVLLGTRRDLPMLCAAQIVHA